ncbi:MAG TPA: hypothetical protein DD670_14305 [Planctomycetaceae bacterium]|nr:hypothetical protein [Planctomycetaceae bacterium]
MLARQTASAILLVLFASLPCWGSEEVRYFEKDGVTYRETRRVVQRPVYETKTQQSTQTVYREQNITEVRDTVQQRWTKVTEYRWEAFWADRWNPFSQPYLAYRQVPYTRWESSTETVKVPVVSRRVVPEQRVVNVPVTTQRMVEEEVISRVAVGGPTMTMVPVASAAPARTTVPWTEPARTAQMVPIHRPTGSIGGVARHDNDPPRQGTNTAWRSSNSVQR